MLNAKNWGVITPPTNSEQENQLESYALKWYNSNFDDYYVA